MGVGYVNKDAVIDDLLKEKRVLLKIILNLWNNMQYNAVYIQYLLDGDEEKFKKEAGKYAKEFEIYSDADIKFAVELIINLFEKPLNPIDASLLLNISAIDISECYSRIKKKRDSYNN